MDKQYDMKKRKGTIESEASCMPLKEGKQRTMGNERGKINGRGATNIQIDEWYYREKRKE